MEEIVKIFDFTEKDIIKDIFYLKEQGYIDEIIESTTSIAKYKVNANFDKIRENYFKPVSIVYDNKICCHCGLCSSIVVYAHQYNCGLCSSILNLANLQLKKWQRKKEKVIRHMNYILFNIFVKYKKKINKKN